MSTQDIYNYLKVNERLITGGQPTAQQLRAAADEGFEVVVNLATEKPADFSDDEGELVRSLGMVYYPLPVEWERPSFQDFRRFETLLESLGTAKMLIHCAANFRVSAFFGLFALKHLGWTEAQAETFRRPVWQGSDYPIWELFIHQVKAQNKP